MSDRPKPPQTLERVWWLYGGHNATAPATAPDPEAWRTFDWAAQESLHACRR